MRTEGPREGYNGGMGCGASATVKNEFPALEARVSLLEFKQWYLKLLVKDASKASKVGSDRVHAHACARRWCRGRTKRWERVCVVYWYSI